jgi:transposase-like protein
MNESNNRERRHFTGKQKLAIVKEHLVDRRAISDLSDELGIKPSQVYQWQKQLFEQGEAAFQRGQQPTLDRQLADVQEQFATKNMVIAQLAELLVGAHPTSLLAPKR